MKLLIERPKETRDLNRKRRNVWYTEDYCAFVRYLVEFNFDAGLFLRRDASCIDDKQTAVWSNVVYAGPCHWRKSFRHEHTFHDDQFVRCARPDAGSFWHTDTWHYDRTLWHEPNVDSAFAFRDEYADFWRDYQFFRNDDSECWCRCLIALLLRRIMLV